VIDHEDDGREPRAVDLGVHHGRIQRLALVRKRAFHARRARVWYEFVPGVTDTGFFNQHFIRDIGIIQLFLGVAFGVGMIRPELRVPLWAAATLWLIAHAVFHLWEVAVGICSPSAIPRDFPAVTLPAIFGVILTLWAIHHSRTRALNDPQSLKAEART